MNISKKLTININMRSILLHKILFLFLKYIQKCTEKILSNTNQQNYNYMEHNLQQILQIHPPGVKQKEKVNTDGEIATKISTVAKRL